MASSSNHGYWGNLRKHMHVEKCVDPQKSVIYCSKDGKVDEWGTRPKWRNLDPKKAKLTVGELQNLTKDDWDDMAPASFNVNIKALTQHRLFNIEPVSTNETRGIWLYGEAGVGKSHRARQKYPDAFIKSQSKWWDGYLGQKVVILDDLDTPVLGHYLKIWGDKWACTGEIKGGTVPLMHEIMVVTSNYSIELLFANDPIMVEPIRRRFREIKISSLVQDVDLPDLLSNKMKEDTVIEDDLKSVTSSIDLDKVDWMLQNC